ncbi:hypothetical protein CAPTEDRAFT_225362 [Capitella teleta]|uniref:UspA domain-containing protein n=1 Tax=Capitella teleta TaxID=283909 RepID=R7TWN0_CAPTE|nr:hypothetical protein CAPTEDRAFT_225362 [Capitella teleta]|eukprot:ELT95826.1 hypothetical protein CAPTEDRAFT_225362 [Capitella teleta]
MADEQKTTVIIAVDGSEHSKSAIAYYVNRIHRPGNHVVLSHVIELPDVSHARESHMSPALLRELWEEEMGKSTEIEKKYQEWMKGHGIADVKIRLEGGLKAGQVICRVADEEHACMIVTGTRGLGTIRRTILGSVSDYLIHHSNCPVVVCRHSTD